MDNNQLQQFYNAAAAAAGFPAQLMAGQQNGASTQNDPRLAGSGG